MLRHWRALLFFALVAVIAIWIQWWASLGFPLSHQICGETKTPDDCESHNIFFYSVWALGKSVDHWNGLITAIATGVIAAFTITIYQINRSQLVHARRVERAYISCGIVIDWENTGRAEPDYSGSGTVIMRPIQQPSRAVVTVSNHGKTPAYITEMDVQICKPADLPKLPDYANCDVTLNLSIGPGIENVRTRKQFGFPEAAAKIIYGRIHYRDIFGDTHTTGFIFQPMASGVILTVERTMAGPEYTAWD